MRTSKPSFSAFRLSPTPGPRDAIRETGVARGRFNPEFPTTNS
jgi:hypothetical protein